MSYPENDPNNFILVLKLNYVQKISRGGWSGFGMVTVGIHPNDFGFLNGHPNKIPTNEMLGDVVKNCRIGAQDFPTSLFIIRPHSHGSNSTPQKNRVLKLPNEQVSFRYTNIRLKQL